MNDSTKGKLKSVPETALVRFRNAWHAADKAGRAGNRVRAGLAAAHPLMNLKAVARIDELTEGLDPQTDWEGARVLEAFQELRELIAPGVPRPGAAPEANGPRERWRCLQVGCNPALDNLTAITHSVNTGHRIAKWPVRSEEGKKRERKRNRNGYHRKYGRGFSRSEDVHDAHGETDFQGGDYGA